MDPTEELRQRTKAFALRIIKLCQSLPATPTGRAIGNQLLRSGTAVGANYRSACRARSKPEFVSKIGIALEEADETVYWLELLIEASVIRENRLQTLVKEAEEIVAIFAASRITASNDLDH
jgi:four helix bundle protein